MNLRRALPVSLLLLAPFVFACAEGKDPATVELCNGLDEDADGSIDETFTCARGSDQMCETAGIQSCTDACEWGPCITECVPGMSTACGMCGTRTCTERGMWGECDGEGDCAAGTSRSCAEGVEECLPSCQWGDCLSPTCFVGERRDCGNCGVRVCGDEGWGPCEDEGCTPGETEMCGPGGTRTCQADCTFGSCDGAGACDPGATQACGDCGTRTCGDGFEWLECEDEGQCSAGATEECGIGGIRTCSATCGWGDCEGEGACASGDTRSCGFCGMQTCNADNEWDECTGAGPCGPGSRAMCGFGGEQVCLPDCSWGACTGEGECAPGTEESCGNCGSRYCRTDFTFSDCIGEGSCASGATEACGMGGSRTCTGACTFGSCEGEGECVAGETRGCGNCGTQTCSSARIWGACEGSGPCAPDETAACGLMGTQTCGATCTFGTCSAQDSALSFNGSQIVSISASSDFDFADQRLTVEAMIRPEASQPPHGAVFSHRRITTSPNRAGVTLGIATTSGAPLGTLYANFANALVYAGAGDDLRDGAWHHIAVTRDGTVVKFYADGVLVATQSTPMADSSTGATISLGRDPTFPSNAFRGDVHNVRVWNVPRTDAQILSDSEPDGPATTTGLVANWRLAEGSGQEISDSAGSHDGWRGSTLSADADDAQWIDL